MKPVVAITTRFHAQAIREKLAPHARVRVGPRALAGADALIAMVTDPVDRAVLDRAPRLRVIGNMAVGIDNIDLAECKRRGIRVIHTPRAVTRATAELALALLFAAARRIPEGDAVCRRPKPWSWSPHFLLGVELRGRHAVLLGRGRIGRETERLFRGVGMSTEFISRADGARSVRRKLARAQVLSLHAPLEPSTRHWLSRARIGCLPREAIVVNTARGALIDERALISALRARRIFAAALDVHEREPVILAAMKRLENVVLLPHVGTATHETRQAMAELVIAGVLGVLAGKHPWNEVGL